MNGLLLLSYPCLEAYIISNFDNKIQVLKSNNLKDYNKKKKYNVSEITKNTLLKATATMNKALIKSGITEYNLESFSSTSLKVFEKEEEFFAKNKYYYLLSLVSIILLDLNIITPREIS